MTRQTNRNKVNDVKERSLRTLSSDRDCHAPQVTPDRQQATAMKVTKTLKIATWNVRTSLQKGKLDNVKREMERLNINILCIGKVRWTGAGMITSGNQKVIFSGGKEHEKGVGMIFDNTVAKSIKRYWCISDCILFVKLEGNPVDIYMIQVYAPTSASSEENLETFYDDLERARKQCTSQDPVIIMGDFNAKVGSKRVEDTLGPHGLGDMNERKEKLVEWSQINNFFVSNTWFQ